MSQKLRIWHIPQVPGKPFHVEVDTVEEGVKLMDALADYDLFQVENNIKPDYCSVQGMDKYDESLTDQDLIDMDLDDRWVNWEFETEDEFFDEPRDYLEWKATQA